MTDLVKRAAAFARQAHQSIDQRRKYDGRSYIVHPEAVAARVAAVTSDAETVAAAWLHDTVEDTPVTLKDIEAAFGSTVMELVADLTDISRQPDGNRAVRKAIDLRHLAGASPRAMTVKLADLIENALDVTRNDPAFAPTYLAEMADLLAVLKDGNPALYAEARAAHRACLEKLHAEPLTPIAPVARTSLYIRMKRLFQESFTALDIADPLLSFDLDADPAAVRVTLEKIDCPVAGVRRDGLVAGFVRRDRLGGGALADLVEALDGAAVVPAAAGLDRVIDTLTRSEVCFVTVLGQPGALITRDHMQKPPLRMWLFGILTIIEMYIVRTIDRLHPDGSWQRHVSQGRLDKAVGLLEERKRRGQHPRLLDCLQFSDKARILVKDPVMRKDFGLKSAREAREAVKALESLRNNLAHAQDIVSHDWESIAALAGRIDRILTRI